jgi:hypothetical protein
MGLDMYLKGEDFLPTYNNDERPMRDGFPVETYILHIKAWRKFAPLHCHIVNVYSDEGHDDCEPIRLTSEDLRTIADVIRHGDLPPDEECQGFFFGSLGGCGPRTESVRPRTQRYSTLRPIGWTAATWTAAGGQ